MQCNISDMKPSDGCEAEVKMTREVGLTPASGNGVGEKRVSRATAAGTGLGLDAHRKGGKALPMACDACVMCWRRWKESAHLSLPL